MLTNKCKLLKVLITFKEELNKEILEDILYLLDTKVELSIDDYTYVCNIDPLDFSNLHTLYCIEKYNLLSEGLPYE